MKKKTIIRIAIIVALIGTIIVGVFALKANKEPNLVPIKPVNTPEIVDIEVIPIPLPEATVTTETIEEPEIIEIEEITLPVEEPSNPSKKVNSNYAFSCIINDATVNIAYGVDEATLKKNPGWLESSAEPGEEGVCVVYGHRNRNHLRSLKGVEIGDTITIETADGSYAYVVESIRIMDANDELTIPAMEGNGLMLSTCYPFHYSGRAPQKYIVTAKIV